ncbi:MAG: HAD-IA family hydrolase [Marinicaulis sp.]|nr:HAD-IA family hydrolase [Marinicaulis sp.]NNE41431.1 HAD-IA family hydrolase [Marinicaulis sp.]NNL89246.1 HAD-IA family hydrolase [Marinicaulis sp.]
MKTGILFDLDGTLVDTAEDLAAAMNFALVEMGFTPVDTAAVRSLVGYGARRMLIRGMELAGGDAADDDAIGRGLTHFLDHYENNIAVSSRPFAGAVEMIEDLKKRGHRFAICTNKREALARALLAELQLDEYFEVIVGADTALAPKPDPAPVRLAMQRIGVDDAIFIGDSDTDILAARNANLPCLVATFGYGPVTLEPANGAIFGSYRDCTAIINSMVRR